MQWLTHPFQNIPESNNCCRESENKQDQHFGLEYFEIHVIRKQLVKTQFHFNKIYLKVETRWTMCGTDFFFLSLSG